MFQQLVEYKEKHGDCLVPSRYEENNKLGKWVETQRYEYTKLQRAAGAETAAEATPGSADGTGTAEAATANKSTAASVSAPASANKARLTEERRKRLESIGFEWKVKHKMKRYYDKQWDAMFERLLKFKEDNGHVLVPKRYPPDMKLGQWIATQRIQYKKLMAGTSTKGEDDSELAASGEPKKEEEASNRLTEQRRKKLEDAGFVWSAKEGEKGLGGTGKITRNSYDNQWDAMYDRLAAFKEENGHCLVPKRYAADPKLGTWCDTQRVQKKKLEKKLAEMGLKYEEPVQAETGATVTAKPLVGRLTDDRIKRLTLLGFAWNIREDWQKHYEELKTFVKEHGHANVPARYSQNRRLGIWVSAQRQQYKLRNSPEDPSKPKPPLTDERIALLNELNFTWSVRSRDSAGDTWKVKFEALKRNKAEHGDLSPDLANFVREQRSQYQQFRDDKRTGRQTSEMTEDRIRQLREIGFEWAAPAPFKRDVSRLTVNGIGSSSPGWFVGGGQEIAILQEALERVEGV